MIKKILILLLFFLTATLYIVLHKLDVSSHYFASNNQHKHLVLMSYADGEVFVKNQQMLQLSAADKGFEIIYNFNRNSVDSDFYEKHRDILDQKIGAGFWLWKPYLIYKTLQTMPENSVLIYMDSGTLFDRPLDDLLKLTDSFNFITAGTGNSLPLRCHLKKEAYKFFDFPITDEILNKEYVWGYFILIKNTAEMRKFVKQWLDVCCQKDALTNEPFDVKDQDSKFKFHTHDQSLLAVLMAKYPDKKTIIGRDILRKKFGIVHHHRHQYKEDYSLLLKSVGIWHWLDIMLWNNIIFRKIRSLCF